jgi:hypothetical protein
MLLHRIPALMALPPRFNWTVERRSDEGVIEVEKLGSLCRLSIATRLVAHYLTMPFGLIILNLGSES